MNAGLVAFIGRSETGGGAVSSKGQTVGIFVHLLWLDHGYGG